MATLVSVIMAVVLGTIGLALCVQVREIYRFRRYGIKTTATITGYRRLTDADGDPRYHIEVLFTLPDGSEVCAESAHSAPGEPPFDLWAEPTADIVYDPGQPTRISVDRVDRDHHRVSDALAYLFAGSTLLFSAVFLLVSNPFAD